MVLNCQFLLHLLGFGSLVPYFSTLKMPLAFQGHTHFKVANYRVSQVIKVNAVFRADKTHICLNATREFYCFAFLMNICFLSRFVIYLFVCVCVSLCICECGGLKKKWFSKGVALMGVVTLLEEVCHCGGLLCSSYTHETVHSCCLRTLSSRTMSAYMLICFPCTIMDSTPHGMFFF